MRNLMGTEKAAEYLGYTVKSFRNLRESGGGPPYYRLNQRTIRYRPEDLDAWLEERRVDSSAA